MCPELAQLQQDLKDLANSKFLYHLTFFDLISKQVFSFHSFSRSFVHSLTHKIKMCYILQGA